MLWVHLHVVDNEGNERGEEAILFSAIVRMKSMPRTAYAEGVPHPDHDRPLTRLILSGINDNVLYVTESPDEIESLFIEEQYLMASLSKTAITNNLAEVMADGITNMQIGGSTQPGGEDHT